jgi:hypothetical protein
VSSDGRIFQIVLNPARFTRVLACVAVLLVLLGVGTQCMKYLLGRDQMLGLVDLFNLDRERNIPSLFSVCLLGAAFVLLATITVLEKRHGRHGVLPWAVLTVGFFLMAVDESWSFHERLDAPMRALLGQSDGGLLRYAWIVPGALLAAVVCASFTKFLARLAPATRRAFIVAGCVYLGGALGMEAVGSAHGASYGEKNLAHALIAAVEEGLEMAGSILFIHALLDYLATSYGEIGVRIAGERR